MEFDYGYQMIGKFAFIINLAIAFKVYNVPVAVYYLSPPVIILLIWLIGMVGDKSGIRKAHIKARFKGIIKDA